MVNQFPDPTNGRKIDGRNGDESLCLKDFPKYNLLPMNYMLITWWLQLMDVLGHYAIFPGAVEQVLVVTNNIMTLGCVYSKRRLMNPPENF